MVNNKELPTQRDITARTGIGPDGARYIRSLYRNLQECSKRINAWKAGVDAFEHVRGHLSPDQRFRGLTVLFKFKQHVDGGQNFGLAGCDKIKKNVDNEYSTDVIFSRAKVVDNPSAPTYQRAKKVLENHSRIEEDYEKVGAKTTETTCFDTEGTEVAYVYGGGSVGSNSEVPRSA